MYSPELKILTLTWMAAPSFMPYHSVHHYSLQVACLNALILPPFTYRLAFSLIVSMTFRLAALPPCRLSTLCLSGPSLTLLRSTSTFDEDATCLAEALSKLRGARASPSPCQSLLHGNQRMARYGCIVQRGLGDNFAALNGLFCT